MRIGYENGRNTLLKAILPQARPQLLLLYLRQKEKKDFKF